MSQDAWKAFLEAGLPDWVVLHGGAVAVFEVPSIAEPLAWPGQSQPSREWRVPGCA
jgi:hypothetical protein